MSSRRRFGTRVFISHAAQDKEIVQGLVELITGALELEPKQLRCTAVRGHTLGLGQGIASTLMDDIRATSVVLGVITSASLESQWVLFELGAAWALGKRTIPVIHPLLSVDILPGPLAGVHAANLGDQEDIGQMIEELSQHLGCRFRSAATLGDDLQGAIAGFRAIASRRPEREPRAPSMAPAEPREPRSTELTQLRSGGALREGLHPLMEKLFGTEIDEFVSQIAEAVEGNTIRFNDRQKFRYHYGRMLENFPDSHFLATSLPYQRYFWSRPSGGGLSPFETQMKRFIDGGGRFTRIFFIHGNEPITEEARDVMSAQVDIGVEVLTADADALPPRLLRFFVIDQDQRIGWQVGIDPVQQLVDIRFTVDDANLKKYYKWFDEIRNHERTRRFTG